MKKFWLLFLFSTSVALAQTQIGGSGIQIGGQLGSSTVNVNGSAVTNPNFNATTPAAPAGYTNVIWQVTSSSVSAYLSAVTSLNNETGAVNILGDSTITVTPSGQNINLHATGAGGSGVQYNPSTTSYIYIGSSVNGDDNHVLGQTITVTSGTCSTSSCSITNSGSNGLSVGDWVYVGALTGWPAIPSPYGPYSTGYGSFQVTAATATSFSFNSTLGAATITGGNAYGANSWVIYKASKLPFLNGHGNPKLVMGTGPLCSDLDTNYTTMLHPLSPAVTGNPAYLIILDCHNDYNVSSATVSSIETTYTDLVEKWHTDGGTVVVSNMSGQIINGSMTNGNLALFQVREWIWSSLASKNYTNLSSGAYADIVMDALGSLPDATSTLFNSQLGQLALGGANIYANLVNQSLATQGTPTVQHTPWQGWGEIDGGNSPGYIYTPGSDSNAAFVITDNARANVLVQVDTVNKKVDLASINESSHNPNYFTFVSNGIGGQSGTSINEYVSNYSPTFTLDHNFGTDSGTNDSVQFQFVNTANGSTSNYFNFWMGGAAKPIFRYIATGEFDLPNQAPASGGPDCLQISSTGSVTNTGAPCGGGGLPGLFSGILTVPTLAGASLTTAYNQSGTFSASNIANGISLVDTAAYSGSYWEGVLATYPATAFTLTELVSLPVGGQNYQNIGVCVAASTSGAMLSFGPLWGTTPGLWQWQSDTWTSPTAHNAALLSRINIAMGNVWVRLKDDGTNLYFYGSSDGVVFSLLNTLSRSAYSTYLSLLGPCIEDGDTAGAVATGTVVQSWKITNP